MQFVGFLLALVAASAWASPDYVVHEWGTHTAVQGSDGVGLLGLQHEEEPLPSFVKSRSNRFENALEDYPLVAEKGIDWEPTTPKLAVTQKLETPVLYFYSPKPVDVQIDVKFPQGIISQVYPNVTDTLPPLGTYPSEVANGYAQWKVHVNGPTETVAVPPVSKDSIWAPSRQVAANLVSYKNENEHLIFYRGVGQWQGRLQVTSTADTLTISNKGGADVPAVFVLETTSEGGAVRSLGAIGKDLSLSTPLAGATLGDRILPMDLHVTKCQVLLENALLAAGLYPLEARAMVETWSRSYFQNTGLRVLYVLPRSWTDSLLPITITPTPTELERVLVGRVEVLTYTEEQEMAKALPYMGNKWDLNRAALPKYETKYGRFAEAKIVRALQVADMPSYLVNEVHQTFNK